MCLREKLQERLDHHHPPSNAYIKKECKYTSILLWCSMTCSRGKCTFTFIQYIQYIFILCALPLMCVHIISVYFKLHIYVIYQRDIDLRMSDIENTEYSN
jgi:hypothetical protein